MMHPDDCVLMVRDAQTHERSAALRLATEVWINTYVPADVDQLVRDVCAHIVPGLNRNDIRMLATALSDDRAESILRSLPSRSVAADALLDNRDPEPFLSFIADLRDGRIHATGWWHTDVSPLQTALYLAQAPEVVALPNVSNTEWLFLFIGASNSPHRLVPTRVLLRHRHDPNTRFAAFALENPHLSSPDAAALLNFLHPATVARVFASTTLPRGLFLTWLDEVLAVGTAEDVINCLSTPEFGHLSLERSPRALQLALSSSLPAVNDLALHAISKLVPQNDVPLAAALAKANTLALADIPHLVAACLRKPHFQGHSRL